ncbi:MAG: hypothetical protein ACM3JC_07615 [Rudaea sp.]
MKTFTASTFAGALALALAMSAGAATTMGTASTPTTANDTMRAPSANANMPAQCANLTGDELGACLKLHGGAMERGASGTTPSDAEKNADKSVPRGTAGALRNDKSGSPSGGASASGATAASGAASGTAGAGGK